MAQTTASTSTSTTSLARSLQPIGRTLTTPVLTQFTPAADCKTIFIALPHPKDNLVTAAKQVRIRTDCELMRFAYDKAGTYSVPLVFSPGVCVSGYIPAASVVFEGTTTSVCCRSGFTVLNGGSEGNKFGYKCAATIATRSQTVLGFGSTGTGILRTTVVDSFYWVDIPYTVVWASSDFDRFRLASLLLKIASEASSLPSGVESILPASRVPGASEVPLQSTNSASGLSIGAQAGIGVGAAAAGITTGALLMWFFIRRRSRKQHTQLDGQDLENIESEHVKPHPNVPELQGRQRPAEMPTKEKAVELYADVGAEFPQDLAAQEANNDMRHELDADYRGEQLDDVATPIDDTPPKWKSDRG